MALTVYYEGQEKINTTLILELWKQPDRRALHWNSLVQFHNAGRHDIFIPSRWSGFQYWLRDLATSLSLEVLAPTQSLGMIWMRYKILK
jgi:hypothetical protein